LSYKGRKHQRTDLTRQSLKQQAMRINDSPLDCEYLQGCRAEPKWAGAKGFFLRQRVFNVAMLTGWRGTSRLFFRKGTKRKW
jgi:hypothetical protein